MSRLTTNDVLNKYARRSTSSLSTSSKSQPSTFVIEIGTRLTRVGIAGEQLPRQVFKTEFIHQSLPTQKSVLYDPKRSIDEQEQILISFFKEVIFGRLIKNPIDSRFIIVDSLFSTHAYQTVFARALFKTRILNASAISFVPAPLMHLVALNIKTALVIDTGVNETLFYPVFDRVVLYPEFDSLPYGAAAVERRIIILMQEHGRVQSIDGSERKLNTGDWALFKKLGCAADICHRFCIATTRQRSLEIRENREDFKFAPSVKLSFGSEFLIVPGIVRETAAEIVFLPCDDNPHTSIPLLIMDLIDRISFHMKRAFLSNLLFVGGLSNMKGFLPRIREELECLLENYSNGKYCASKNEERLELNKGIDNTNGKKGEKEEKKDEDKPIEYGAMKYDIGFYTSPDFSPAKFCTAWIGASLIGSHDLNQWFTRQQWEHNNNVPDWTTEIDDYLKSIPKENYKTYDYVPSHCDFIETLTESL